MTSRLNVFTKLSSITLIVGALVAAQGCSKSASFSLLSDSASFTQNSAEVNGKIDILFVIDNSGSMATSQQNLATNIQTFFDKFDQQGFDYQIAVTTSEAYRSKFGAGPAISKYRDGVGSAHTGYFLVTPTTPNRVNVFKSNILQGTSGNGDERVFSSFKEALDNADNKAMDFPRAGAFFSIIMLSDADDLSASVAGSIDTSGAGAYGTPAHMAMYTDSRIDSVQSYIDYLDLKMGVTGSSTSNDRSSKYNVNTIGVLDAACEVSSENRKHGDRMVQLTNMTGGITGSLCGNFGETLSNISHKIIELRTRFTIERQINPDTLKVFVNGIEVPRVTDATPAPWNGIYFHADDNSVSFHGTAVPSPGASISVSFDPTSIK